MEGGTPQPSGWGVPVGARVGCRGVPDGAGGCPGGVPGGRRSFLIVLILAAGILYCSPEEAGTPRLVSLALK